MSYNPYTAVNKIFNIKNEWESKTPQFQNKVNKMYGNETVEYNPFTDKAGRLLNKNIDYQTILDSGNVASKTKDYITKATGLQPNRAVTNGFTSGFTNRFTSGFNNLSNKNTNSDNSSGYSADVDLSGLSADKLAKMDISSELPKLSSEQIATIINKKFSKSSVITAKDADGIKKAQDETGMSALAILGIGALESGWGTSNIAKKTNNIWGYGATNINPEGNAHRYGQMSEGASQFASEFMKTYYNGYGAKSIYSAGSGDNPKGMGYAYFDNGKINSGWVNDVSNIMSDLCKTLTESGQSKGYSGSASSKGNSKTSSSKGQAAVDEAKKYLGVNYVWGGSSPNGFDCSGLVQYVYNKMGIDIPRTTYDQINAGTKVDKANLQPGDLVFFGSWENPRHVGMYVGDGKYIQAPSTGDVVKISNLSSRRDYLTARRVS